MATAFNPSASRSPAPWAEVVPGYSPVTVDLLLTMPDDGYIYEVVEGVLVRMAGSGEEAATIGGTLYVALRSFVQPRRLGIVTPADGVYRFSGAETGLLPDVGFYLAERRVHIQDRTKPIPFAPDLAAEVASPSQVSAQMAAKARVYLRAGTRLLWVVWPQSTHVDVWHAGVLTGPVRALTMNDSLDGEDVIPGFSYPVAELFRDPLTPEQEE
ncbi:MAG TPA: Uma2 family endonuclease [Chloroflexota bacterium]|nr:Uma2 family endonuclease [Chloroflexota bacterium]